MFLCYKKYLSLARRKENTSISVTKHSKKIKKEYLNMLYLALFDKVIIYYESKETNLSLQYPSARYLSVNSI